MTQAVLILHDSITNMHTLSEATEAFLYYSPAGSGGRRYKLERMRQLMTLLGNPQDRLRVIHVAGTSGKTSTSYFIRAMLQAVGQKTGLTVSPHVVGINERVQVNGEPLPERAFVTYATDFLNIVQKSHIEPTYFELLVALAYWVFAKEKVDYAVIETGLGGLMDGTNVVARADKICAITDIGFDHTEILGETIAEIAVQKAGIIQPGNAVFIQSQDNIIMDIIRAVAAHQKADVHVVSPKAAAPDSLPPFQRRNWRVAKVVFDYVRRRDNLPALTSKQRSWAATQTPPGRLEIYHDKDKTIIIDGAHNPQKLKALKESLQTMGITRCAVLANLVEAPEAKITASLKVLQPITARLIIPEFASHQDVRTKQSLAATDLANYARQSGITRIDVVNDPADALKKLRALPDSILLVTGSLYLVSAVRAALLTTIDSHTTQPVLH